MRLSPSRGWIGLRAQAPNVAPFVAVQQSTFVIAQAFYIAWMDVMLVPCASTRSLNVAASKPTSG